MKEKKEIEESLREMKEWIIGLLYYPSSFGGVNQPFFSWIWTNDLKDCWARAKLYWPLVALNWMRALPLTSVAAICKIKASIVYAELHP